jgi:hypothetical protein
MYPRCAQSLLVFTALALTAGPAPASPSEPTRMEAATGVDEQTLTVNLHASTVGDAVTIVKPTPVPTVLGMMWGMWPYTINYTMVLRPAVCHKALENKAGAFYLCSGRTEYIEAPVPPGWNRAIRNQAIFWKSSAGDKTILFGPEMGQPDLDADTLLDLLNRKLHRFNFVAIAAGTWSDSVRDGVQDISAFASIDKASTAAFAPHDRDSNSKPLKVPPASIDAGSAIIWGDSRPEEQVQIEKVDQTGYGSFNGYTSFAIVPAGRHVVKLNYYRPGSYRYEFEQSLNVDIVAGKTYVVSFDAEDKPYIEDLGSGTYCELRRFKQFGMAGPVNTWLSCRPIVAPASAPP